VRAAGGCAGAVGGRSAGGGTETGAVRGAGTLLGEAFAALRLTLRCTGAVVKRPATGFPVRRAGAEAGAGRAGCGVYVPWSTGSAGAGWAVTTGRLSAGSDREPGAVDRAADHVAPIRPEGASCRTTCRSGPPNDGLRQVESVPPNSCVATVIAGLIIRRSGGSAAHDRFADGADCADGVSADAGRTDGVLSAGAD
jgi:hypothetical protein